MPRDNDKNNGRPPRRDGGAGRGFKAGGGGRVGGAGSRGGEGRSRDDRPARSSGPRGDKKFGDRKFGDKRPSGDKRPYGEKRAYAGKRDDFRKEGAERGPRKDFGSRDRGEGRPFRPREDRAEGRSFKPRGDRSEGRAFKPREDRGEGRSFKPRDRDDRAPRSAGAGRFQDKKFGDRTFGEKRAYTPRGEGGDSRPARFNRDDRPQRDERPRFNRDDRPRSGRDDRRGAPDRGPRREFSRGEDRGNDKPWQKRGDDRRDSRPPRREGGFDKPRFGNRGERDSSERPRFSRPRSDSPREDRAPRGRSAERSDWHEHPRSETRRDDRPRRDNEDDSRVFVKRPAFGGRGEYRERKPDTDKRALRAAPEKKKSGERIAKIVARAGLCSRRDAEEWITQGRVAVNGRVINSPALDVTANDVVTIDGKPLPERERTRLFLYHKPRGLMTTHDDPEGRPTVFDNLPEGLPRLISIGRLDFNTEGLLLLTNDGGLSRALEHPDTGWLRRYRVRAHGDVTQAQLDQLKNGVEVDGVKYGSIEATLERDKGSNVWIVFAIREGKNREVRNVMAHLGLEVNRLIRVSYGPFQLGEIEEGQVEEIKSRVLREQLGEKIVAMSGAQFDKPVKHAAEDDDAPRGKGRVKPAGTKNALIADRKGRKILVTRAGSEGARARNEEEAGGYGVPRRPTRGYKGKRDLKPRDTTED
ncbi:pseudouridine synthase [Afipia clevelandensis]|uniref:Pseudouridine synthase n=1 Tax=Afipia clevelandensis ATCC 49720 TaxID=883079 RepID=K8P3I5_9BRAD|nr:pseudouridine synthase [Afipia clevelandensis]EKS35269.1 pseudouridine synthase [Afipia clevelandensis ATCC 49720]